MQLWRYEARNGAGKAVDGTLEAASREAALATLRAQGLFLTKLETAKIAHASRPAAPQKNGAELPRKTAEPPRVAPSSAPNSARPNPHLKAAPPLPNQPFLRASKRDLSAFFRQLASAQSAGVSLGKSLQTLEQHAPSASLRAVARQIGERVRAGEPLSRSLNSFPALFSPLAIGIVGAGERGGFLDRSFARLADYAERDYELETEIKRRTWYPKLIVFAAILIPGVVPLVLQGFGAFLAQVLPPLLVIAAVWAALKIAKALVPALPFLAPIFAFWDGLKLRLPVIGKVARGLATAKFCRALGALYSAGVSSATSVQLAAQASDNARVKRLCEGVAPRIERGETLTQTLGDLHIFHPMALQMLSIGEESGDLDTQLEKSADFLERDAETAIRQAIPLLGILAFLAVAAYVGSIVVAAFTGYGNFLNELSQ